jgi:hypothetical protein
MTPLAEFVDAVLDASTPVTQIMLLESQTPEPDMERVREALSTSLSLLASLFSARDLRIATAVLEALPPAMVAVAETQPHRIDSLCW